MPKIDVYVSKYWDKYNKEFRIAVAGYEPYADSEFILIDKRELEYSDMEELALKAAVIRVLRARQQKVRADAQVEVNGIDAEIQELLALEAPKDAA
jgi:hypothetical protein